MDNDVYNFGFILLESLVGPITRDKGETFFINEKVSKNLQKKICLLYEMWWWFFSVIFSSFLFIL